MRHVQGDVKMEEAEIYYDEKSRSYDETFSMLYFRVFDAVTWKYLEPYLPANPNAMVLDAGGGTGRWTVHIAKKALKVVLMDLSEGMLKVAAQRMKLEGIEEKVVLKKGDLSKTGYADETFDLIFCEHTLFLFEEPDTALKEFNRILKRKARLIVSAHNRYVQALAGLSENPDADNVKNALRTLLREKPGYMTKDDKVKINTWTPIEFQNMLERNGFHVEKVIGKGMTMPLRISKDVFMKKEYSENFFNSILQLELAFCDKPDALALAGHMQAIACKK
jgi:ubiquinone/menaquinone biosynthesis C-methylase UbiE